MYTFNPMDQLISGISVDCVIFGFDMEQLKVLLIERDKSPDERSDLPSGTLKLPGSLIKDTDDLERSAYRILKELTGLDQVLLKQFAIFDRPDRLNNSNDLAWLCSSSGLPIRRVITVTYYSLVRIIKINPAKTLFDKAYWIPVKKLPKLAFDHNHIVESALKELRKKLLNELSGLELLPKKFTIRQFQNLYAEILGKELDKRNFRKRIHKLDYLIALPEKERRVNHKPAQLYKLDRKKLSRPERMWTF
jgi:8-oxo-dGTP diphosphatase